MGSTLTTSTHMACPHAGTVNVVSAATKVDAGDPVLRSTDTFNISGCTFTLPGPKPSPCLRVQWLVSDVKVTAEGEPTLSTDSLGLCLSADMVPQGMITITGAQTRVSTT
jgi:hypothetical protein